MIDITKPISRITYNGVPMKLDTPIDTLKLINDGYSLTSSPNQVYIGDGTLTRSELYGLFRRNDRLQSVTFSNIDIQTETLSVGSMFAECNNLNTVTGFDELLASGKVSYLMELFQGCSNLGTIDVSSWDMSNITDTQYMFQYCMNLQTLDVSNWNTQNFYDTNYMFYDCSQLQTLDVSGWRLPNLAHAYYMFANCYNLQALDVSNWGVQNLENADNMFYNCSNIQTLDLSKWKTGTLYSINGMFQGMNNLREIDISGFDLSGIQNTISGLFNGCNNLTTIKMPAIVPDVDYYSLEGCSALTTLKVPQGMSSAYQNHPVWQQFLGQAQIEEYETPTTTYVFVTDGGSAVESITQSGALITAPTSTPTDETQTFSGWYLDAEFNKKAVFPFVNMDSSVTTITFYAKFATPDGKGFETAVPIRAQDVNTKQLSGTVYGDSQIDHPMAYGYPTLWLKFTPAQSGEYLVTNISRNLGGTEWLGSATLVVFSESNIGGSYPDIFDGFAYPQSTEAYNQLLNLQAGVDYYIGVNAQDYNEYLMTLAVVDRTGSSMANPITITQADIGVTQFKGYVSSFNAEAGNGTRVYYIFACEKSGAYYLADRQTLHIEAAGDDVTDINIRSVGYYDGMGSLQDVFANETGVQYNLEAGKTYIITVGKDSSMGFGDLSFKLVKTADPVNTTYNFVTDGGTPVASITQDTFIETAPVTTSTDPTKIFAGWYLDGTFTQKVKFPYANTDETVTSVTLYALYIEPDGRTRDTAFIVKPEDVNNGKIFEGTITDENEKQLQMYTSDGINFPALWFKFTPNSSDEYIAIVTYLTGLDNPALQAEWIDWTFMEVLTESGDWVWGGSLYNNQSVPSGTSFPQLTAGNTYIINVCAYNSLNAVNKVGFANRQGNTPATARLIQQSDIGVTEFKGFITNLDESRCLFFDFVCNETGVYKATDKYTFRRDQDFTVAVYLENGVVNEAHTENAANTAYNLTAGNTYNFRVALTPLVNDVNVHAFGDVSFILSKLE